MRRCLTALILGAITCTAALAQYPDPPCIVTPFSVAPVAMQGPLVGDLTGSVHIGSNAFGDHFVSSNVDGAFYFPGKIITSVCSRLLPGANRDGLRKALAAKGVPNCAHASWIWLSLSFDDKTGEETEIIHEILDDHGRVLGAAGSLTPTMAHYATWQPGTKFYHADVYEFFKRYERDQSTHLAMIRNGQ